MLETFTVFHMDNLKVHYNSHLLYFSSQTSMEQPHIIDHPKNLYRSPGNCIVRPLFTAKMRFWFSLPAKNDALLYLPHCCTFCWEQNRWLWGGLRGRLAGGVELSVPFVSWRRIKFQNGLYEVNLILYKIYTITFMNMGPVKNIR